MSNRTSLISTTLDDGDPALYRESSDRDVTRQDFVCIGEAANRLPVPWLCCFREQDLRPYRYRYDPATEGTDDDSMLNVLVPVTTLAQALENLEQSRPVFDELCQGDVALADEFWRYALRSIASAPMPFLTIELVEVIDSQESLDTLRPRLVRGQRARWDQVFLRLSRWLSPLSVGRSLSRRAYGSPGSKGQYRRAGQLDLPRWIRVDGAGVGSAGAADRCRRQSSGAQGLALPVFRRPIFRPFALNAV